MSPYIETETLIRRWLTRERGDRAFGMSLGQSYIDFTKRGRLDTVAAIKFNRNLLISETFEFPNQFMNGSFRAAASHEGFQLMHVPQKTLSKLRSCLRENGVPNLREAKAFGAWLPPLEPYMKPFPRLNHKLEVINRVRVANAFMADDGLTHVLLHIGEDKGKTEYAVRQSFTSEDEAMLFFMKLPNTENLRIMEIGG